MASISQEALNLKISLKSVLPIHNRNAINLQEEGSIIYDRIEKGIYCSNGVGWLRFPAEGDDATFGDLDVTDNLVIPKVDRTAIPIQAEGSVIYDTVDDGLFYSDGAVWLPAGGTDAVFGDLDVTDNLVIPKVDRTAIPIQVEGSVIYDTVDDGLFYSDGAVWLPAGGTDAVFETLDVTNNLVIPKVDRTMIALQSEGSVIYDTVDDGLFYSDGAAWLPVGDVPTTQNSRTSAVVLDTEDSKTFNVTYTTPYSTTPTLITNITGDSTYYDRSASARLRTTNETATGFDLTILSIDKSVPIDSSVSVGAVTVAGDASYREWSDCIVVNDCTCVFVYAASANVPKDVKSVTFLKINNVWTKQLDVELLPTSVDNRRCIGVILAEDGTVVALLQNASNWEYFVAKATNTAATSYNVVSLGVLGSTVRDMVLNKCGQYIYAVYKLYTTVKTDFYAFRNDNNAAGAWVQLGPYTLTTDTNVDRDAMATIGVTIDDQGTDRLCLVFSTLSGGGAATTAINLYIFPDDDITGMWVRSKILTNNSSLAITDPSVGFQASMFDYDNSGTIERRLLMNFTVLSNTYRPICSIMNSVENDYTSWSFCGQTAVAPPDQNYYYYPRNNLKGLDGSCYCITNSNAVDGVIYKVTPDWVGGSVHTYLSIATGFSVPEAIFGLGLNSQLFLVMDTSYHIYQEYEDGNVILNYIADE